MRHIPTVPHQTVVTNITQLGERMCSMIEFITVQSQLIYLIVQTVTKVSRCNFTTKILNFFINTYLYASLHSISSSFSTTWQSAENRCVQDGGHLTTMHSQAEFDDCMESMIPESGCVHLFLF